MSANLHDDPLSSFGKVLNPRPSERDPRSPFCQLHLQRICGTCTHFDGHLRQDDVASCTAFCALVQSRASAAKCGRWSRKVAEAQQ